MKIDSIKLSKRVALTAAIVTPTGLLIDQLVKNTELNKKFEEEKKKLEEKIKDEAQETVDALSADNERLKILLKELKEQLTSVIPEIDGVWAKNQFEKAKSESRKFRKLYQDLLPKYEKLTKDFEALEKAANLTKNDKDGIIETLEGTITDLIDELDRVNAELAKKDEELKIEKDIVVTLDKDRDKKDKKIEELSEKLKNVQEEYDMTNDWTTQIEGQLAEALSKLERDKGEIKELKNDLMAKQNGLKIKDVNIKTKNRRIVELEKELKTYKKFDPNNYDPQRCGTGIDKEENTETTAVACDGGINSSGEPDSNIIVQLFFKKEKAGKDFDLGLNRHKAASTRV